MKGPSGPDLNPNGGIAVRRDQRANRLGMQSVLGQQAGDVGFGFRPNRHQQPTGGLWIADERAHVLCHRTECLSVAGEVATGAARRLALREIVAYRLDQGQGRKIQLRGDVAAATHLQQVAAQSEPVTSVIALTPASADSARPTRLS